MRLFVAGLAVVWFGAAGTAHAQGAPFKLYCLINLGASEPIINEFVIDEKAQTVDTYKAQISGSYISWQTPASPVSFKYVISRTTGEIRMAPTNIGDKPGVNTGTCSKTNPRKF